MEKICVGCKSSQFERVGDRYYCIYCGRESTANRFLEPEITGPLVSSRESIEQEYDFQQALSLSQSILEKYPDCQEANWFALLAENQIIYIQNGQDEYVPTFLDADARSITDSKYYKALDNEGKEKADAIERKRLEAVAEMDKVKGNPYDIFISYKQHEGEDGNGAPTDEAELAQSLYNQLIKDKNTRDLNIFFDKESLGKNNAGWEPHIYSAIKTSKFMIVVASSIENINSRWVKNEWMRFLKYKSRGDKKELVVLGTRKEQVDPRLFPKMIAETKSQALYERDDWRENICARAFQACKVLKNDKLGTVEFVDKKTGKKTVAKKEEIELTDLGGASTDSFEQSLSFTKRLEIIKSDLSSDRFRQEALNDLSKLKAEVTRDGKTDGRILALELVAQCNLYTIEDFNNPENLDKIKDLEIFRDIFNNGGTTEWKYSILEILYNYLINSKNETNKLKILNIIIDFKYKRRSKLLNILLANSKRDLSPEIFNVVLPRLEYGAEQETAEILDFASKAFDSGNFTLAQSYAGRVLTDYDEGNIDAKDLQLLSEYRCKNYQQFFAWENLSKFTAFEKLQEILSYMKVSDRISKLDFWNECILTNCQKFFPENFYAFYDRFLMFYPSELQGEKLNAVAQLALRNKSFDISTHYLNYLLQHSDDKVEIYWQMMLSDLRCCTEEDLYRLSIDIKDNKYFDKALSAADDNSQFTSHILEVRQKQREAAAKNRAAQERREALEKSNDVWAHILDLCRCKDDDSLFKLDYSVYEKYTNLFNEAIDYAGKSEDKNQISRLATIKRDQGISAAGNRRRKKIKQVKIAFLLVIELISLAFIASVVLSILNFNPFFEFWTVWAIKLFKATYGQYILIGVIALIALIVTVSTIKNLKKARSLVGLIFGFVAFGALAGSGIFIKQQALSGNFYVGEGYILSFTDTEKGYVAEKLYVNKGGAKIEIPAEYNQKQVVEIAAEFLTGAKQISVTLPETITTVSAEIFSGNTEIVSVEIPKETTMIEHGAFYGCTSLNSITVPFTGTSFRGASLKEYSFFGSIFGAENAAENKDYVPETLKMVTVLTGSEIKERAFTGCKFIEHINLPNELSVIGENAFNGCSALKEISLNENLTSIGKSAFQGCASLESVHIENVGAWSEIEFADETSNPLFYAGNLFKGDEIVTALEIPDGTDKISGYAFINAKCITSVKIPDSVTEIGICAFSGCNAITEMSIPFVGASRDIQQPFHDSLFGFIFGAKPYEGGEETRQYYSETDLVVYYVPTALKKILVSGGNVLYGAFSNCKNLSEVILSNVGTVSESAFSGCEIVPTII